MRNKIAGLIGAAILCLSFQVHAGPYLGDYNVGDTVCGYFNTYQPSTGASFTLASGAVQAFKDGSATEDTDGLTLDNDFDSDTGYHQLCVDTTADGTFYSAGSRFSFTLSAGTVDSVSVVGTELFSFSLHDGQIGTIEDQTDDIGIAGAGLSAVPDVDTLLEALVGLGAEQTADSGTTTTIVDAALTQATNDWFAGQGVAFTSGTLLGQTACITAFTASSDTLTITTVTATVGTQTYYILPMAKCQTGDSFARLGAPAGASVSADVVVLDNFVDDLETRVGTPSNLGGGATVAFNLSDIEGQTDDIGAAGVGLTGLVNAILLGQGIPAPTTIATLASQTSFTLTAGSADDNAYNGYGVVVRDASTPAQTAMGCARDYTGSTKTLALLSDPGIFTMATTDNVILLPAFCDAQVIQNLLETALLICTVDTANFAGDTNDFACDLTDRAGVAVTSNMADGDLTGLEVIVVSGAQQYEKRFVSSTTDWDGPNNEMRLNVSRVFPATLADNVTVIIR